LTMISRALQEGSAPAPWDDASVVRARLEATMGIAWASQCLDPHPEIASDEHTEMYIAELVSREEQLQQRGLIGAISADIFQTRPLVGAEANDDPVTVMLYGRALRQSVDTAVWVVFNWLPDLQTAGLLIRLLLDDQFDAFFAEIEKL